MLKKLAKFLPLAMVGLTGFQLEASDFTATTSQITTYAPQLIMGTLAVIGVMIIIVFLGLVYSKVKSIPGFLSAKLGGKGRRRR